MENIDKIYEMLHWKNSVDVQSRGMELARKLKDISLLVQPAAEPSVWEKCAIILYEKSDEILESQLMELIDWLYDLNWPGALIILDRLKKYNNLNSLSFALSESVKIAVATDNHKWLENMSELLTNEKLTSVIPSDILSILKEHHNN